MLIPLDTLRKRFNVRPRGALHIGANIGEEAEAYYRNNITKVIWIEGNPDLREQLEKNISKYQGQKCYIQCVGDENKDTVLHISNNASQSSSVLDLGTHKTAHPEVHFIKDIPVRMSRIDDMFAPDEWGALKDVDFLNIDLQGAELMALRGMGDLLKQFKWAYLEVNKEHLYENCPLVEDIDLYMLSYGFRRVVTEWAGNTGWGDALYSR